MKYSSKYHPSIVKRYDDSYFENRFGNDKKRQVQFLIDGDLIKKFKSKGTICDVGCSTGEFLKTINWQGKKYGMEINKKAIREAKKNGIDFDKNIFSETNFFDVIVFRGTIQHVDEPFRMIKSSYKALKKGGIIIFLAVPNSDSLIYRLKLDLPFLSPSKNFFIPGKISFCNALTNFNFKIDFVEMPYWKTPYRNMPKDLILFLFNLLSKKFYKHAFWGNSMSIVASKS